MNYLSFDYSQFNEKGLKNVIAEFKKNQLQVTSVEADNKAKRQSGVQTKKAILHFSDGQKLMLQATAQGSIFQVRLNTRVIPVKHVDDLKKAIAEIAAKLSRNSRQFKKQQEQRAKKPVKRSDSSTKAKTSLKAQTAIARIGVDELTAEIAQARQQKETAEAELVKSTASTEEVERNLASESDTTAELEQRIKQLEGE